MHKRNLIFIYHDINKPNRVLTATNCGRTELTINSIIVCLLLFVTTLVSVFAVGGAHSFWKLH